jgi:hypothetical protein
MLAGGVASVSTAIVAVAVAVAVVSAMLAAVPSVMAAGAAMVMMPVVRKWCLKEATLF